MRQRVRNLLSSGVGLFLLFSGSIPGYAEVPAPSWVGIEGFRGLSWGVTTDRAHAVFPDLAFVRYAITDGKETPSTLYERKNEDRRIDGIRVDEILYWFRSDAFYKVTIALSSKVGPRTLETPAAEAFDRLRDTIRRVAGAPIEDRTRRGTLNANRKSVWQHGDRSIALSCFDPPGVNGEELVLEIEQRTSSKRRMPE